MFLEQKFKDIGLCIYCGRTDLPLTEEHIIPLALFGTETLKKASCDECRTITSKFEVNPVRDIFKEARASLGYPSRHKKFDKMTFPVEVILKDGSEKTVQMTRDELTPLIPMSVHILPGYFRNIKHEDYGGGTNILKMSMTTMTRQTKRIIENKNIKSIKGAATYKGNNFENMIARIAYCFVVSRLGLDSLEKNYILPTILSKADDIGYWQGCDVSGEIIPPIGLSNAPNAMRLSIVTTDIESVLVVTIKFFAQFYTPEYIVVVGTPTAKVLEALLANKSLN